MTKLAWATDTHLDFVGLKKAGKFGRYLKSQADSCVITGDIATGDTVCDYLTTFQERFQGDVYFVLGNHDRWMSSFAKVESDVRTLCKGNEKLHWLGMGRIYQVGDTQLCGVDGWYDFQAGSMSSRFAMTMNDWHNIKEFLPAYSVYECMRVAEPLIEMMRALGQESAVSARSVLASCDRSKPVIFATHVPPFQGASWYGKRLSPHSTMPFYSNIALGYVLNEWASEGAVKLTTICGHAHSKGEYQAADNHKVLTGEANYGQPQLNKVFHL